jgi:hypothetical protein
MSSSQTETPVPGRAPSPPRMDQLLDERERLEELCASMDPADFQGDEPSDEAVAIMVKLEELDLDLEVESNLLG